MKLKKTIEISGIILIVPEIQGMIADGLLDKPELAIYMRGGNIIKIKFTDPGLLDEAIWDIRFACER